MDYNSNNNIGEGERLLLFGPCGTLGSVLVPLLSKQVADPRDLILAYHQHMPKTQQCTCAHVDLQEKQTVRQVLLAQRPTRIVFMLPTVPNTHAMVRNFVEAFKEAQQTTTVRQVIYVSEGDIDEFLLSRLSCYDGVMDSFQLMAV